MRYATTPNSPLDHLKSCTEMQVNVDVNKYGFPIFELRHLVAGEVGAVLRSGHIRGQSRAYVHIPVRATILVK